MIKKTKSLSITTTESPTSVCTKTEKKKSIHEILASFTYSLQNILSKHENAASKIFSCIIDLLSIKLNKLYKPKCMHIDSR